MEALRKGTPTKAARLLGLPGTQITNTQMDVHTGESDDDNLSTPTKIRTISNASAKIGDVSVQPEGELMEEIAPQNSRSSSTAGSRVPRPGKLSSKRSLLLLGGSRKKNT